MDNIDIASVDAYIDAQPEAVRPRLQDVRRAIRASLPQAAESISYKMPTYKIGGLPVLYFAGWKDHYSLYPATSRVVTPLADALAEYTLSRGTIRFPLGAPVPVPLIARIAALRAEEVAEVALAKANPRSSRARKP